ncbi:hypothetical protein AAF712_002664 [Marasmius tenuissimus]|uniref:Uncharacterized protein n=1 Tax=Marasmius tenuissimus TaxID=585030 RepID=A0ABR3AA02_9AGAR
MHFFTLSTLVFAAVAVAQPMLVSRDDTCYPNFKGATIAISDRDGTYRPPNGNSNTMWSWHVEQNGQWPPGYIMKDIATGQALTQAAGGSLFMTDPYLSGSYVSHSLSLARRAIPTQTPGPERAVATKCTIMPQSKSNYCLTASGENYLVAHPCTGGDDQYFTFATFN